MDIKGKFNKAKVFTNSIDDSASEQIKNMLDQPFVVGESIRIMPDVHAGKGSTIGTTMTIHNHKVVPNLVGVDIGCGISVYQLKGVSAGNWEKLDAVIAEEVPSGIKVHKKMPTEQFDFRELSFLPERLERIQLS